MIEVILNDRMGKKVRVKCNPDDTVGDLKKLAAAQTGTRPEKIRLQKWRDDWVASRCRLCWLRGRRNGGREVDHGDDGKG